MCQVNKRTRAMLKHGAKASRHAKHLRSSLNKMLHHHPEAASVYKMVQDARSLEVRLDNIMCIIEEIIHRDPATYAALFLSPEEAPLEIGATAPADDELSATYRLPHSGYPPYRT